MGNEQTNRPGAGTLFVYDVTNIMAKNAVANEKTAAEKEAARVKALEATAGEVPGLKDMIKNLQTEVADTKTKLAAAEKKGKDDLAAAATASDKKAKDDADAAARKANDALTAKDNELKGKVKELNELNTTRHNLDYHFENSTFYIISQQGQTGFGTFIGNMLQWAAFDSRNDNYASMSAWVPGAGDLKWVLEKMATGSYTYNWMIRSASRANRYLEGSRESDTDLREKKDKENSQRWDIICEGGQYRISNVATGRYLTAMNAQSVRPQPKNDGDAKQLFFFIKVTS